jgi:phage terminase large subunit-like protein
MPRKPLTDAELHDAAIKGDWKAIRKLKDRVVKHPERANLQGAGKDAAVPLSRLVGGAKDLIGYDPNVGAEAFYFDFTEAARVVEFFHNRLTHVEGTLALQPLRLEPWQQCILVNLVAWKRADGTRRYRQTFILVPRKNGKTTLAAGIVLYLLYCGDELGQRLFSAAADRDQASLIYETCKSMILQDPGLGVGAKTLDSTKRIEYARTNSFFKSLTSEAGTKRGVNPSCAILDEIVAMKDAEMVRILRTAMGSRAEPLEVGITTADFEQPSVCNRLHDLARKIAENPTLDLAFLPVVFEAGKDDDWTSPEVWAKVNPNLGVSVTLEYLERECKLAIEMPSEQNTFKREHLNIRTSSNVVWMPLEAWDKCGQRVDPEALKGRPCFAGLDLASTKDLTALVLLFPGDGNAVLPFYWVPRSTVQYREARFLVPSYAQWEGEELLEVTPGPVCDYAYVRRTMNELAGLYAFQGVAYDRKFSGYLITELAGDGFEMVSFGQGYYSMSGPSKQLEKLVLSEKLRHGGHPILRWNCGNTMVEMDPAGGIKPSRVASGPQNKIDGIVALVMALGLAIETEDPGPCVYEERGLLTI